MRYNNHIKKQIDETGIKHSAKFLTSPDAKEANHRCLCLQKRLDFFNYSATFCLGNISPACQTSSWPVIYTQEGVRWWGLMRSIQKPWGVATVGHSQAFCTACFQTVLHLQQWNDLPCCKSHPSACFVGEQSGRIVLCMSEKCDADGCVAKKKMFVPFSLNNCFISENFH